jgi:NAD(P)-dependent dehydrogenase (short-subunit alcohol dehydrogenase family)
MSDALTGKSVLVTGGGSGLGRAAALAMSAAGASLVIADRDRDAGERAAADIVESGGKAHFIEADVSRAGEVEALVAATVKHLGRLDCAFNNAGVEGPVGVPTAEVEESAWDQVLSVNLKGVWLCMKHELAQMQKQGAGSIVNTASVAGLVGGTFGAAYYASKHGVVGLTRAAAVEYGRHGIRVNAVCPGVIRTEMAERLIRGREEVVDRLASLHPMGRLGRAEEVAQTVTWLCSDAASFVTGQAIAVDGGYVAQ